MGIVEEEDGVLKLVHPGAAAQVLENNPRHSITRLDVFEYPWIVVKVIRHFVSVAISFIDWNEMFQFRSVLRFKPNNRWFKQSLPITSCMGTAFQEQDCDKRIRNPPGKSAGMSPNQHQSLPITSWIVTSFQEQDCDKRDTKPAKVESWAKFISSTNHRKIQQVRLDLQIMKSIVLSKRAPRRDFPRKNHSGLDYNCMEEVINLRPCLRKQDSARKLFQLKVSFNLPVKDEEQRRAVHKTRAEVSGNCSCSSSEILCIYKPCFSITRVFLFLS
ncbi:Phototropic-responsive NPH3 family protein [Salix suchowensis]|nr:Phototropic-responsive NPH3 family protein [Salix suchowensis]